MRRSRKIYLLLVSILTPFLSLALATVGRSEDLELDGFVKMDKRLNVGDGVSNGDTYGKLRLEGKDELSEDLFALVSTEVRYYDYPVLEDLPAVGRIESDYPADVLLWEAYLEASAFGWENLDLKIGKQRIAWGTADKFNPTDNLNPNDLTDFLDFEAKVPSYAVKASYYLDDYTITGVWLPFFEPALLPRGGTVFFLNQETQSAALPARTLGNGMFALKFSGVVRDLDFSLSYFRGFDDLPVPESVDSSNGLVLGFPEIQVLGLDFAGEFRSVGFWGETALFFPEEIKVGPNVVLAGDPFLKYTFGIDYTFNNGIYLEVQYVHGFFTERGKGNLNDYLIGKMDKRFFNDELKVELGAGLGAKDLNNADETYGVAIIPEISYRPIDSLELTVGAYLFGGKNGTLLGMLKDQDQMYFKAKLSF